MTVLTRKRVATWVLGLSAAFALHPVLAAEWSMQPAASLQGAYYSNILFTSLPHQVTWGEMLSPSVDFTGESEIFKVTGGARLNFHHYSGTPGLDSTDRILTLDSSYRPDELDTLGLGVNSTQASTLVNAVTTTGIVEPSLQQHTVTINPSWSRFLTQRISVRLDYNHTAVNYQNPTGTYLTDYQDQTGTLSTRYLFSERGTASLQVYADGFNTVPNNYRARTYGFSGGFEYTFSETMRGDLNLGLGHTKSTLLSQTLVCNVPIFAGLCFGTFVPLATTIQSTSNSVTATVNLTKQWETRTLTMGYTRAVVPSGVGSLVQSNQLQFSLSDEISPRWTATLQASAISSGYIGNTVNYGGSRYYQVQPELSWRMSRWWTVSSSVMYATVRYNGGQSLSSNTVYLTLKRDWPKFSASR